MSAAPTRRSLFLSAAVTAMLTAPVVTLAALPATQVEDAEANAWLDAFLAEGGSIHNWEGVVFFGKPMSPENPEIGRLFLKASGPMRPRINAVARGRLGMGGV